MENRRVSIIWTVLILAVFAFLFGLFLINGRLVEFPGAGEDFLPAWAGTRQFLLEGNSPYGAEANAFIENQYQAIDKGEGREPLSFLYPFYSVLIFAPFAMIPDFQLALRLWMVVLEVSVLLVGVASISLSKWHLSTIYRIVLAVLLGLWVYSVHPIIGGHASAIAALCLVGAFLAIRSNHEVIAGFLLAFSTIKPQATFLLILFILIWAISKRRWLLVWSSLLITIILAAVMSLFVPSWLSEYGRALLVFWFKSPPSSPGDFALINAPGVGRQVGWGITVLVIGTLLWEWRAALGQDFRHFYWAACLTLALTPVTGIPSTMENYILLIPAFVLVLSIWDERWGRIGWVMMTLSAAALFFGLWAYYLNLRNRIFIPEENAVLFLVLPFFLAVGLYWSRWWAIRPPRLPLDVYTRNLR